MEDNQIKSWYFLNEYIEWAKPMNIFEVLINKLSSLKEKWKIDNCN